MSEDAPAWLLKPVAAALIAIAVICVGAVSYLSLPIAELPAVDLPTIVVTAQLPGASPETMASTVATPIEKRIGQIAGVEELTSSNVAEFSTISVQFGTQRDISGALTDVQAAVNAAESELPTDMPSSPTIQKINPTLAPILFLAASSDTMPFGEVYENVNRIIAQPLSQIKGVSKVAIQGGQATAIRVRIDPARLADLGLSASDVRTALEAANGGSPLGMAEISGQVYLLSADDQIFDPDRYAKLVVGRSGGAVVRLGDVAEITEGVADERVAGWYNMQKALFVLVQRDAGSNIVETATRVREALPRLERWLPPAIQLKVVTDRTFKVRETVLELWKTMLATTVCVIMMILLSFGEWRAAVVPIVAIPISVLGTFVVMQFMSYSIDTISLTALTVCIGFVVDDAVVMLENIVRHREAGMSALAAAVRGAREINFTIIAITVSLVAALAPLIFVPGVIGEFLREFSVTLCAAIIISGIVALTLTPIMCANFLSETPRPASPRPWLRAFRYAAHAGVIFYERSLAWALGHARLVLAVTIVLAGFTFWLFDIIPKGFIPIQDTGIVVGFTEAGQDLSFAAMSERQLAVSRAILEDPAVDNVTAYIGTSAGVAAGTGRLFITLKPRAERDGLTDVVERLKPRLAGVVGITTYLRSVDDIGVGAREGKGSYQFTLQADAWPALNAVYPRVLDVLKTLPQLRDVSSDQLSRGLQVSLQMDRDRAALLDVSARSIDEALYDAFGQRPVTTLSKDFAQEQVILEVGAKDRTDPASLDTTFVKSQTGESIPLRSVTTRGVNTAALAISHQGQFPAVTISFNVAPGEALGTATAAIRRATDALSLPPGVRVSFEGTARAFGSQAGSEPWLVLASLLAIYIVLGILYESYIHPLTILSSLPSAGLGGLLAALVTHLEFSLLSFVGLILLLGIVKKNAIMMIDVATSRVHDFGEAPRDAIYNASLLRLRPIMMTTLTALVGALPLALDTGAGAELRRSFGIVVVGGLIVSQALTLYTTPVIYLFMERLRHVRWLRRRGGPAREPVATGPR